MYSTATDSSSLPSDELTVGYFDPAKRATARSDDDPLACCWSENKPAALDILMACLLGVSGIGSMGLGLSIVLRPDGTGVSGGSIVVVLGAVLLVAGLIFLLYKVLRPQHAIAIYPDGVEIVGKKDPQKYLWNEIHKILTLEFTPHIGARMIHVVWIEPVKGSPIRFDTSYEGEAQEVLDHLTTKCDYIVRNPSGYTKRTT